MITTTPFIGTKVARTDAAQIAMQMAEVERK